MKKAILIAFLAATQFCGACVSVKQSTSTYTVDSGGCVSRSMPDQHPKPSPTIPMCGESELVTMIPTKQECPDFASGKYC